MHSNIKFLSSIVLLLVIIVPVLATESSVTNNNLIIDAEPVQNPLRAANEEHGRLYFSPYDPEHFLYPVKILAIDGWFLPDEVLEEDLRLAAGEHRLLVIPDFSTIEKQMVFMQGPWQEKQIIFTINNNQNIAVAARILNRQDLSWQVQMYRIPYITDAVNKEASANLLSQPIQSPSTINN